MVDSVGVTVVSVRAVKSTSPGSRVSESKFEADHVRELEAPAEIAAGVAIRLLILGRSESEVRVPLALLHGLLQILIRSLSTLVKLI